MNSTKAYEYETLQRAKDVVSKITKPSMSKVRNLKPVSDG